MLTGAYQVLTGRANAPGMTADLLERMFRLRYEIFHRQLGWDVDGRDGMERDMFDDLDPVYVIAVHRPSQAVVGCVRMLPTTGPHMLRDVPAFQPALDGRPVVRSPQVWEVSRLAVAPEVGASQARQAGFRAVPRALLGAAGDHAIRQGVVRFVTLSSVLVQSMVNASGLPSTPIGAREPVRIGSVLCTAYSVPAAAVAALSGSFLNGAEWAGVGGCGAPGRRR